MAEEKLLTALELDDKLLNNDGESYQGTLGSLYRRQGRFDEAIERYHHAAKITPGRSYPFLNLALLYYEQVDILPMPKGKGVCQKKRLNSRLHHLVCFMCLFAS